MANKPLKSIKFPNLPDTYTVPQVDSTLTVAGGAADAQKTGQEIDSLREDLSEIKPFSDEAKQALLNCFAHVAWADSHGQDYYDALEEALTDTSGYIGDLTFKLGAGSCLQICGGFYDSESGYVEQPNNASRSAGNAHVFTFKAGDSIMLDDTETYSMAIGNNSGSPLWIGGGYLSSYPYILSAQDVSMLNVVFLKRNDGLDFTQEDIAYLYNHVTVTRAIDKTLANLFVSYDGTTIETSRRQLVNVRPHLTVTAQYTDGTSENVTFYDLSGEIVTGTNILRIKYGNKTATVSVNAVEVDKPLFYDYDFYQVNDAGWGHQGQTPEENDGFWTSSTIDKTKVWIDFSGVVLNAGDTVEINSYWKFALGTNKTDTSYSGQLWITGGFAPNNTITLTAQDIKDAKVLYIKRADNQDIIDAQLQNIRNEFLLRRA